MVLGIMWLFSIGNGAKIQLLEKGRKSRLSRSDKYAYQLAFIILYLRI